MIPVDGHALVLTADDCVLIAKPLRDALRERTRRNGAPPTITTVELVDEISRIAAARIRRSALYSGDLSASNAAVEPPSPASVQERLTTAEAARLTRLSEGHVRHLCRQGTVTAERSPRGGWLVDTGSLVAWREARHREV
jgi:hypothetical protein